MKRDSRSDVGRGECRPPAFRTRRDYKQPRWATAYIEYIDNIFATASPSDVLSGDGTPKVRVDLDGVGEGGASLTDHDENVSASLWLSPEKATDNRNGSAIHIRGLHYVVMQLERYVEPPTNCSCDRYQNIDNCSDYLTEAGVDDAAVATVAAAEAIGWSALQWARAKLRGGDIE